MEGEVGRSLSPLICRMGFVSQLPYQGPQDTGPLGFWPVVHPRCQSWEEFTRTILSRISGGWERMWAEPGADAAIDRSRFSLVSLETLHHPRHLPTFCVAALSFLSAPLLCSLLLEAIPLPSCPKAAEKYPFCVRLTFTKGLGAGEGMFNLSGQHGRHTEMRHWAVLFWGSVAPSQENLPS